MIADILDVLLSPYPNDVQIPGATGIPYYATMDRT